MKRSTSNALGPLMLLLAGSVLQGCGGTGDGDATSDADQASSKTSDQSGAAPPTATAPADLLALFPTAGPPGSTVAARGAGFQGHCAVALFLDGLDKPLSAVAVQRDGAYSTQIIVPEDTAEGAHTVIAQGQMLAGQVCTEPSATMFEATFTVTARMPVITLEALEGRPGTAVQARGRGFCAEPGCSTVTILVDGQIGATGVVVDGDASFIADVLVPAVTAAGAVAVVAIQTNADGIELRAFGEIIVTVRPNRSPNGIS